MADIRVKTFGWFIVYSLLSTIALADSLDYRVLIDEPATDVGVPYKDALYLPISAGLPDLESKAYQAARKARLDAYIDAIRNPPPPPPEPTKAELQKQAQELQSKLDELNAVIATK